MDDRAREPKAIPVALSREQRIDAALQHFREQFPKGGFGKRLTKKQQAAILGFGPDGV